MAPIKYSLNSIVLTFLALASAKDNVKRQDAGTVDLATETSLPHILPGVTTGTVKFGPLTEQQGPATATDSALLPSISGLTMAPGPVIISTRTGLVSGTAASVPSGHASALSSAASGASDSAASTATGFLSSMATVGGSSSTGTSPGASVTGSVSSSTSAAARPIATTSASSVSSAGVGKEIESPAVRAMAVVGGILGVALAL